MPEQTLEEKTAKGLFWGGISSGVQQLLGMLFGIYLARVLNAEDYGLVGMLAIFSGIAGTIINSGFSVALTNKQDVTHKDYNAVFWFTFFIGLGLYVVLFFSAPFIAKFYGRPELVSLSRVLFISFFFSGMAIVPYTVMFKQLMVKKQAKIDITAMLMSGIVGVSLAMNGLAYWALAWQSVTYLVTGALLRCVISPWRPTLELDFTPLKSMLSFSVKMFLTSAFQQINGNIFSVLLGKFYSATQLGYYSQGNKWMGMGNQFIVGMINMVAQPVIVQVNNDKERQLNIFRKMIRFSAFVAFPAFLGLAFIAKEFILITIGEKWLPSVSLLQILCIWGITSPFVILYTQLIIAHGKSNIYLWGNIITGLLQFVVLIILYYLKMDIIYLVIGYVISYFCSLFYWHYTCTKFIDLKLSQILRDVSPYLFIAITAIVVTSGLVLPINNMYLLLVIKIISTACLYISILWLCDSCMLKESFKLLKRK